MENDEAPQSNVDSTIKAVTGFVQAIPIYQDAIQPAAKQIGQSLETISKTINIALFPIRALVWKFEQIEDHLLREIPQKLKDVPEEKVTTPPANVAGPAIEALRFYGEEPNLRELFTSLLATAMNTDTIHKAHPGYIDIIKNMTSDEAILMKCFVESYSFPIVNVRLQLSEEEGGGRITIIPKYGDFYKSSPLSRPDLFALYIDNLCRLGILEVPEGVHLAKESFYEPLENNAEIISLTKDRVNETNTLSYERRLVRLTEFGRTFVENIVEKSNIDS